jgi:hypothetical protein
MTQAGQQQQSLLLVKILLFGQPFIRLFMSKHESQIQATIAEAVEFFFSAQTFGFCVPRKDIRIVTPPSGGQARDVEDFGRKPYDLGFFASQTIVLFFEIKERDKLGKISEFKTDQRDMLSTLRSNGVDIRYAYNGWDYTWEQRLEPTEVLKQAHVREAKDMAAQIHVYPVSPAQILEEYLRNATAQGNQTLVDILGSKFERIDTFNSMPLMILANLDPENMKVLIDRAPINALKIMKTLFDLPDHERQAT